MKLSIKKTKTGKGVFAGENIKSGALVCYMSGNEASWGEVEGLIDSGKLNADDPFQVAEERFILLDPTPRYFNHACAPNAGIVEGVGGEVPALVALRDITVGEEIAYDYSSVVCVHCDWRMACACGSGDCRGIVKNARSIPKNRLREYMQLGVLPLFIKKELARKVTSA